jgi:2,3-bisphosphoglycerate-dependent phosphoglycerate mutase
MLFLVRHAMPDHGPHTPAREWHLSADGLAAARVLCERLPAGVRLVASTEPKAIETLQPAGDVLQDRRLDEIDRVEAYADDFRRDRRAYVEGTDLPGWEPREQVVRRFDAAVREHLTGDLVIASHGMAMTLWLMATIDLRDPGAFWEDLRFPDLLRVDLDARRVSRPED